MKYCNIKNHRDESLQSNFENKINSIISPIESFIYKQTAPATLLFISSILSMFIINIMPDDYLEHVSDIKIGIHFAQYHYVLPLKEWINCGFMTFFFFFVGIEIRQENLASKLQGGKEIFLIIFTAFGGIAVPALLYLMINYGRCPSISQTLCSNAWLITIVSDAAFSISILAIFKSLLSLNAIIFFTTLVVFNDVGAMMISSLFSDHFNFVPFSKGVMIFLILILLSWNGDSYWRSSW